MASQAPTATPPGKVMEYVNRFFQSPMWNDTIKDFVLANCVIFMGEPEFSHEHAACHKRFCRIIEDTLNIYLLEVLRLKFDQFEEVLVSAATDPQSIAADVLRTLKQATDFGYFAAKMHSYNVMLDRQAQSTFVVAGRGTGAFFQAAPLVDQISRDQARLAMSDVVRVEREIGVPVSPGAAAAAAGVAPGGSPGPAAGDDGARRRRRTKASDVIQPTPSLTSVVPVTSAEERQALEARIAAERAELEKAVPPEALAAEREAIRQARDEFVASERAACREHIERGRDELVAPEVTESEDTIEAIRRVMRGTLKVMIAETGEEA